MACSFLTKEAPRTFACSVPEKYCTLSAKCPAIIQHKLHRRLNPSAAEYHVLARMFYLVFISNLISFQMLGEENGRLRIG